MPSESFRFRPAPLVLSLCLVATAAVAGSDWPHLRGPASDGRASGAELDGDSIVLEPAWKAPLGSAYSGVVAADGRVVTMYSDGKIDRVVALAINDGSVLWKHEIGQTYKGHDGSVDGPLSTPTIAGDRVVAIGPRGDVLALNLADGKLLWKRHLIEDFGSRIPTFGFTTTPSVVDGVVVIQTGGDEGRSVSGLSLETGKTLWSHGDDRVDYSSPSAMTLAGQSVVVVPSGSRLEGLSAADGRVLWVHDLGEGARLGSSIATAIGADRFVVSSGGRLLAIRVSRTDDGYDTEILYESNEFGRNYAKPVFHEGHLYGFKNQILSCVDAETGELVWKSRPPGGSGLILVDGYLVIYAKDGMLVVAPATADGYEEAASIDVLTDTSYSWPGFADGHVLLRDYSDLIAVSLKAVSN